MLKAWLIIRNIAIAFLFSDIILFRFYSFLRLKFDLFVLFYGHFKKLSLK